jgi:hypothetical protein
MSGIEKETTPSEPSKAATPARSAKKPKSPQGTPARTANKEKSYTVLVGSLVVGKGELRTVGQKVKSSEIPADQAAFFANDGTLKEEE